jgi:TolA-binding protein
MMESSGSGAASEDRVAALEKKAKETEALVKGLTQELLDLKSIVMKMSKQTDERSRQELKKMQAVAAPSSPSAGAASAPPGSGSTVVMRTKSARQAEAAAEQPTEPAMDMIMQPDGTMKLEPRRGDKNYIVARAGYGRDKKGSSGKAKQTDIILATEEEKKDPAKK